MIVHDRTRLIDRLNFFSNFKGLGALGVIWECLHGTSALHD